MGDDKHEQWLKSDAVEAARKAYMEYWPNETGCNEIRIFWALVSALEAYEAKKNPAL